MYKRSVNVLMCSLVMIGAIVLYGCSSRYACKTADGVTCMKVQDVIQTPPGSIKKTGNKSKEKINIPLNTKRGVGSETPEVITVQQKPIIITIFSYIDKDGVVHGTNDYVIPPKPPELELNKE